MQLLLIRHALPLRVEGPVGSIADPPLAPAGHQQAAALAELLAEGERQPVTAVVSSPLRRARETAEHLGRRLGLDVVIVDGLAEHDRLSHEYVPIEELRAEGGERWEAVVAGTWESAAGLDRHDFQRTVVGAVESVVAAHPGTSVAVVAHGGVINAYLAHVLGLEPRPFFEPAYAGVSRVLAARSGAREARSINEHSHVRALL